MELLEKYTPTFLKAYEIDKLEDILEYAEDGNPWNIWLCVKSIEKNSILPILPQKKQLFIELIEYYMNKGILRFEGTAIISSDQYLDKDGVRKMKNEKLINFEKNSSISEIVSWFDNYFPTEERAKEWDETLEQYIDIWMYLYAPDAYWFWKDPENKDDEGTWYSCD